MDMLLAAIASMDLSPERIARGEDAAAAIAEGRAQGTRKLTAEELHFKDPTKYPKPGAEVVTQPPVVSAKEKIPKELLPTIKASKTSDELRKVQAVYTAQNPTKKTKVLVKETEEEVQVPDPSPPARKGVENAHDRKYFTEASFDQMAEVKGEWAVLAELGAWASKQAETFKGTALSGYYEALATQAQNQSTAFMAAFAQVDAETIKGVARFRKLFQADSAGAGTEDATQYQGTDMSLINEPPTANEPSQTDDTPEPTTVEHGDFTMVYRATGDYTIAVNGVDQFDGTYDQALRDSYNGMRPEERMQHLTEDLQHWAEKAEA